MCDAGSAIRAGIGKGYRSVNSNRSDNQNIMVVIVQIGCQPDDADTGSGRTVFCIAAHGVDNILGHFRHYTVCDTVIHIDGKQITEDSDTDAIIFLSDSTHGIDVREALRIGGIGPLAVCPVGNLGYAFIPLFLFPVTKMRSLFKLAG